MNRTIQWIKPKFRILRVGGCINLLYIYMWTLSLALPFSPRLLALSPLPSLLCLSSSPCFLPPHITPPPSELLSRPVSPASTSRPSDPPSPPATTTNFRPLTFCSVFGSSAAAAGHIDPRNSTSCQPPEHLWTLRLLPPNQARHSLHVPTTPRLPCTPLFSFLFVPCVEGSTRVGRPVSLLNANDAGGRCFVAGRGQPTDNHKSNLLSSPELGGLDEWKVKT